MNDKPNSSILHWFKNLIIGKAKDPNDQFLFQHLSLIAFFAWVGLGADGISSACYGPQEAFLSLAQYKHLTIFVGIASAITVVIISASYSQIIELFPGGGGGYLVASKLLSPKVGMVSGCALLVDYVLTIAISVASGADAIFSFLPPSWYQYKLLLALGGIVVLILLNLRGVKESVIPLIPIFLTFIITHVFAIVYAVFMHAGRMPEVVTGTYSEVQTATSQLGLVGVLILLVRAYSMGAGTYTGIEAVSNGMAILREPRVQTGKRTMRYMAGSLAFMAVGLMFAYLLYDADFQTGRTLNAVLFEKVTGHWGMPGYVFVFVALLSEAAILFVAAQTGFLDGPRVLSNMAADRWFPTKFTMLSDRFVTQNGILIMGGASLILTLVTNGSVGYLVVLYSINVFITFVLSQTGMVRHWWNFRGKVNHWKKKLAINGFGLVLTMTILLSVLIAKFYEGGWITLLATGTLVVVATSIKRYYRKTARLLRRLDTLVAAATEDVPASPRDEPTVEFDPKAGTAVILVNGFNGLGLHTLFGVIRLFKGTFKNFIFMQVGVIDAGVFKGSEEMEKLKVEVKTGLDKYISYVGRHGFYAEGISEIGTDVLSEVHDMASKILKRFPQAVFYGGQIIFPEEKFFSKWLHNYIVFTVQRKFYHDGIPFVILPIKV